MCYFYLHFNGKLFTYTMKHYKNVGLYHAILKLQSKVGLFLIYPNL